MHTIENNYLPTSAWRIPYSWAYKILLEDGSRVYPDSHMISGKHQCWNPATLWSGLYYDSQPYLTIVKEEDFEFHIRGLDGLPKDKRSRASVYFAVRPFCERDRSIWIKADGLIETVNNNYDSVTLQHWRGSGYTQDSKTDNTEEGASAYRQGWVDTRWDTVTHVNQNPLNNGETITKNNAYVQAVGDQWDKSMYGTTYNEETGEYEPPEPRFETDAGDRVETNRQEIKLPPRACPYMFRIFFDSLDELHQLGGRIYLNFHCEIEEP